MPQQRYYLDEIPFTLDDDVDDDRTGFLIKISIFLSGLGVILAIVSITFEVQNLKIVTELKNLSQRGRNLPTVTRKSMRHRVSGRYIRALSMDEGNSYVDHTNFVNFEQCTIKQRAKISKYGDRKSNRDDLKVFIQPAKVRKC